MKSSPGAARHFVSFLWITAGVLQGCCLSGLLFGIATAPFLQAIVNLLMQTPGAELAACADDLCMVLPEIQLLVPLQELFDLYSRMTGASLNEGKCVLDPAYPKWSESLGKLLRLWLRQYVPA